MNQTSIRRLLIENLADRYLPKLQFDPNRSIRNLVDMGECLSNGKTQKRFFRSAQKLLEKENSPYYALIRRIISQCDPRTIKTFGMNLGFHSWLSLSGRKRPEAAPPWTMMFQMEKSADALSLDELTALLRQSVEAGIHTFLFWLDRSYDALDELTARLKGFSDCAFALFSSAEQISPDVLDHAQQTHNILLSLNDSPGEDPEPVTRALRDRRCPYALHTVYSTPSEAEHILCGKWLERVSRLLSPFAFFFPGASCPEESHTAVREYARTLRTAPQQPVFSMSLCDDIADVDELISGKPRLLRIRSNGTLASGSRLAETDSSLQISLSDLLARYAAALPAS